MSLYLFPHGGDPGPSFVDLLRRVDLAGAAGAGEAGRAGLAAGDGLAAGAGLRGALGGGAGTAGGARGLVVPHATTIVALRFEGGVAMAGDRRATEGHAIAHRAMVKVFPADRFSAVAVAGAAGFGTEMVRLFQTQLEHYEKVEGSVLSLEGKANQLGQMVRANLQMAMEGLVVVPLFAGYDTRRRIGRIFSYDVTGGRYEEAEYHATGSGGRDARNTVKAGYREGMPRDEAIELLVRALFDAAEEDSATGGPDPLRGIYPIMATIDAGGFADVAEEEIAERFAALMAARRRGWRADAAEREEEELPPSWPRGSPAAGEDGGEPDAGGGGERGRRAARPKTGQARQPSQPRAPRAPRAKRPSPPAAEEERP